MDDHNRAKIFLSCGQRTDEERQIAAGVAKSLEQLGFEVYVAVKEQTLAGLKENIFRQLEDSDYYILIDFTREKLIPSDGCEPKPATSQECRGSLFCHQELAVASFLEVDAALFHERDVCTRDGIMQFIQGNSTQFTDRNEVPKLVRTTIEDKIDAGVWHPQHRKKLQLAVGDRIEHVMRTDGRKATFFPIDVKNLHRRRLAVNCTAYLERIVDRSTGNRLFAAIVEVKWGATRLPTIMIAPGGYRQMDGFFVLENSPGRACFSTPWTDFTGAAPPQCGPGEFEFTYAVSSANFPLVRQSFFVQLSDRLSDIKFRRAD